MKKTVCFLMIICLCFLSGCDAMSLSLSDPDLDTKVKEMFTAMAIGDKETQNELFRSDAVFQEGVTVEGEIADSQPLSRDVDITNGVTQKDARYRIETTDGTQYIILVRYIIDENEEGFYQYTVAKNDNS